MLPERPISQYYVKMISLLKLGILSVMYLPLKIPGRLVQKVKYIREELQHLYLLKYSLNLKILRND